MTALPDYLTDQTEEGIRGRMLDRVPVDVDKAEGSFVWDALAPAAYELFNSAVWAQEVLRRGFATTTFGDYLDLRCEEHGVARLPAGKAAGEVKFTGRPGTNVPSGQIVSTAADPISGSASIEYALTAPIMLDADGEATAAIEAVEPGAAGNVPAAAVIVMASSIPGIASVTNPLPIGGGVDIEDDESLLNRFLQRVRSPAVGGNKADYLNWALEVTGVGAAVVLPLWNGPETVKVVILGADKTPAGAELVDEAQAYISPTPGLGEGKAPIGAFVTVEAAEAVPIDVAADVVLAADATLPAVLSAFEAALTDYFRNIAFSSDPSVKYVRIGSLLLDTPGVSDYSGLTINGAADNLAIGSEQVAVKGTVALS